MTRVRLRCPAKAARSLPRRSVVSTAPSVLRVPPNPRHAPTKVWRGEDARIGDLALAAFPPLLARD